MNPKTPQEEIEGATVAELEALLLTHDYRGVKVKRAALDELLKRRRPACPDGRTLLLWKCLFTIPVEFWNSYRLRSFWRYTIAPTAEDALVIFQSMPHPDYPGIEFEIAADAAMPQRAPEGYQIQVTLPA